MKYPGPEARAALNAGPYEVIFIVQGPQPACLTLHLVDEIQGVNVPDSAKSFFKAVQNNSIVIERIS
jgi:hypothetical protein